MALETLHFKVQNFKGPFSFLKEVSYEINCIDNKQAFSFVLDILLIERPKENRIQRELKFVYESAKFKVVFQLLIHSCH